jgi:hypothetical protein
MATKQIHELTAANQLAPEDQLLVSTADGNRTRRASLGNLPYRVGGVGTVLRTLLDKLGERVSVRDFGAKGDGVADDSPAFQAALDAHEAVHVPPGRYRLNSEIQIKPRRTLVGAGRDATLIDARGPRAFTFNRNAGIHAVEAGGTPDWCRSRLGQMSIRMTTGGVRAIGHELYAEGLRFSGGQPGGWCMELEDANECSLREISAGPGGGQDDLLASGIRLYATDANRNVNFGDSLLEEISIKLKGAGTTGILIEHQGTAVNGSFFVMNNLLLNRVQVNSAGAPAGSTGVWLKRVMRSALLNVDVEFVETAFRVEGVAASGNAGSCRHVSFVNCYVLNCAVPWVDSNAALAGSVMRCSFSNCHGFGLLNPVGIASNDANARAGEGDTFMPGAVWLTEPNTGQPAVQLRAPNPGQLLLTGEFYDGTSAVRDGNPKNKKPRQGLGVDITSFNVTRLYRPRGYATGEFSRLVVGNGEDFLPDGATAAPLHRVELADPVYLTPRQTEPPQALNGFVVYCETSAALPSGSPWTGPGWYARLGNRWQPGVQAAGRVADKERNATFTVSPLDFGLVHRVNNSAAITVNVASSYDLGSGSTPLMQAGDPDAVLWLIRQGTGDVTIAAGDAGVEVKSAIAGATNLKIKRQYQLVTVILRFNATSGKIEVYGNTVPDGEFVYEEALGWTNASQGSNTDTSPYVVASSRAGQLLRISSSDNPSHIAFDTTSMPAGVTAALSRICAITNPIRIMARQGGGLTLRRSNGTTATSLPCFQVNETGRVVTVHVTGGSSLDPNQANSIYIEN